MPAAEHPIHHPEAEAPLPPGRIRVDHTSGDAYAVAIRGHRLVVDQPFDAGGDDSGPTPTELFAASLASCVAFYAGRYLARHGVAADGLRVDAEFTMATDRPARVTDITVTVDVPPALDPARHDALLAVASNCTVHHTLQQPPTVRVALNPAPGGQ
ncbi:OsmC family protein [Kitasatospora sp. NPDC059673]|uniref:OsmC family protein n=1 Tax=Kitasatospora sp. NPDC059673 TaxID=3346901 RepID=UPI0036B2A1F9